eukprot:TRINITY_DN2650_c0_g1_i1.p1 TRINITY_DN2650_c0_g1~~TRINITY_DN2650_c0_g1_i1.p1  ORF type:complete len:884 (+),score=198.20 TRINITY_DN2650_c0_g1_i1:388-2652(+)
MGEFGAVLNGVSFWTRHNDYQLSQPRQAGGAANYNKLDPIEQPDVPPSVLSAGDVPAQVAEMQEYFRAFAEQDTSIRDYRPFFQPILCVLEGAWIQDSNDLAEPFDSDRHFIDASTWEELNDMTRFLFNSGRKNNDENLPYLPSSVRSMSSTDEFTLSIAGGDATPLYAFKQPTRTARSQIGNIRGKEQHFENESFTTMIVLNNEGLFLYVQASRHGAGPAGGFTASFACGNDGCLDSTALWCGNDGQTKNCRTDFTTGSGTSSITYNSGKNGHILYGPLKGTWSVDVTISDQSGLTGSRVWVDGVSFLPVDFGQTLTIAGVTREPVPTLANFEYRIFCHKLKDDLPTNRFRVRDDISQQLYDSKPLPSSELIHTRRAIFDLNSRDSDRYHDGKYNYQLIDTLMEQIPGKDNYEGNLEEVLHGLRSFQYESGEPLNAAYYSRYYQMEKGDAMGRLKRKRGFNDANLWAAKTTQPKVAGLSVFSEEDGRVEEKWTWAIPLEIIYLTPLVKWNHYDIVYHDRSSSTPTAGGRNGEISQAKAYDGSKHNVFYRTPVEFFGAPDGSGDAADTVEDAVGVLDSSGTLRTVAASGHWIHFPPVAGVEHPIRQRYPLAPFHTSKGHGVRLATALKHSLQSNSLAQELLEGDFINFSTAPLNLFTNAANPDNALHKHDITVNGADVEILRTGTPILVESDLVNGHTHTFRISAYQTGDNWAYEVLDCDGVGVECLDGHDKVCETADQCRTVAPTPTEGRAHI